MHFAQLFKPKTDQSGRMWNPKVFAVWALASWLSNLVNRPQSIMNFWSNLVCQRLSQLPLTVRIFSLSTTYKAARGIIYHVSGIQKVARKAFQILYFKRPNFTLQPISKLTSAIELTSGHQGSFGELCCKKGKTIQRRFRSSHRLIPKGCYFDLGKMDFSTVICLAQICSSLFFQACNGKILAEK